MKRRTTDRPLERDWHHRLHERVALKLIAVGAGTPERERRWARNAGLPVAELRRRAKKIDQAERVQS
jgi:hypothetical protein